MSIRLVALLVALAASPATSAQQCAPACDLDGDGATGTPADYGVFFSAFSHQKGDPGYNAKADLDDDGMVGPSDWQLMLRFCPLGR